MNLGPRVSPHEAQTLIDTGHTYVDVRAPEEFRLRHPRGALNVPLLLMGPSGMTPNPEFMPLMKRLFTWDDKIVVGCATGVRSERALAILTQAGFSEVFDQRAGIDGRRNAFGGLIERGWADAGLPVAEGDDQGSFEQLKARG